MEINHMKPFITPEHTSGGKLYLGLQCEGVEARHLHATIEGSAVVAYAIPKGQTYRAAWIFHIELDDGRLLEFSSACTQILGWHEVGSLNIRLVDRAASCGTVGELFVSNRILAISSIRIKTVDVLVYEDVDVISECGLVISGQDSARIVIAAGIPPGSVSIETPDTEYPIEPQFDIAVCRQFRIEQ